MKFAWMGLVPDHLKSYLRDGGGTDSLRRLVSWMAATTLCIFGYGLLLTIEFVAATGKPIDPVLRDCFIAVVGFIATLAIAMFRKSDPSGGPPDAPPQS